MEDRKRERDKREKEKILGERREEGVERASEQASERKGKRERGRQKGKMGAR